MRLERLKPLLNRIISQNLYRKIALYLDKKSLLEINYLRRNFNLKNIGSNNRCFIIANGPSIRNQNLSLLENEIVFTCNYFPLSKQFQEITPHAHFILDNRFFINEKNLSRKPLNSVFSELKKKKVSHIFLNIKSKPFINEYPILDSFQIYYLAQSPNAKLDREIDLTTFIPEFSTVVHSAICAALYMNFKEIYLLGCDCTGFATYAKAYNKDMTIEDNYGFSLDKESTHVVKSNMTMSPIEDELRNYAQIFDDYKTLNRYCEKNNRRLTNLTDGGVLNYLPREKYLDVANRKSK